MMYYVLLYFVLTAPPPHRALVSSDTPTKRNIRSYYDERSG